VKPGSAERIIIGMIALAGALSCTRHSPATMDETTSMKSVAEEYVHIVLAVGEHDGDYVDAYYGPPEWREKAQQQKIPLETLRSRVQAALEQLARGAVPADELERLRHRYLQKQLSAVAARIDMLSGKRFSFDEESRLLYDAVSPHHDDSYYQRLIDDIDRELPGNGTTSERVEEFRQRFIIPPDRLDRVFREAIRGCRERVQRHFALPAGESFSLEYVRDKPWSGYNWYKGGFASLIQVNTDLPIFIDRAVDLACHEGYPGHHVYNALLEKNLVRERGWVEFSVYPLFSPQSLIAEGSANYGIDMAFPQNERSGYEKEVLFPLAGLNAAEADRYYRVLELLARISYAGNEAARDYLDGRMTADAAVNWLVREALYSPERARQRLRFVDKYRSYVINYNLGKDLVAAHIEKAGHGETERWRRFRELLSSPRLPSDL
jgi:hypothetical protein